MKIHAALAGLLATATFAQAASPEGAKIARERGMVIVHPAVSDAVLTNPGIGFMTFQRFNGDDLNPGSGWTEGNPIEYQPFDGDLHNKDHPDTTLAYFRVAWCFAEPKKGEVDWKMFDKALDTAAARGQQLIIRIMPYGSEDNQHPPKWYMDEAGDNGSERLKKWWLDPENPAYLKYFGDMIHELGRRYDGHPSLYGVDISIVGFWGEGAGTHLLKPETKNALIDAYLDAFPHTHLFFQPLNGDAPDPKGVVRGTRVAAWWPTGEKNDGPFVEDVGYRFDCIGDLGFWRRDDNDFAHMYDVYPEDIIRSGMYEAWKHGPVSAEICGTLLEWRDSQHYSPEDAKYIFDEAIKWHVSTFNAKSSPVPPEYKDIVDDWLKHMGYRFVLRRFEYPAKVRVNGKIPFKSWWDNRGNAPCYDPYPLALRLHSKDRDVVLIVPHNDIRKWMPGDNLCYSAVFVPPGTPAGTYTLEIGILDMKRQKPAIKLAIEGRADDGWYPLSTIDVVDEEGLPLAPTKPHDMP